MLATNCTLHAIELESSYEISVTRLLYVANDDPYVSTYGPVAVRAFSL
jgi:hypothetical protein